MAGSDIRKYFSSQASQNKSSPAKKQTLLGAKSTSSTTDNKKENLNPSSKIAISLDSDDDHDNDNGEDASHKKRRQSAQVSEASAKRAKHDGEEIEVTDASKFFQSLNKVTRSTTKTAPAARPKQQQPESKKKPAASKKSVSHKDEDYDGALDLDDDDLELVINKPVEKKDSQKSDAKVDVTKPTERKRKTTNEGKPITTAKKSVSKSSSDDVKSEPVPTTAATAETKKTGYRAFLSQRAQPPPGQTELPVGAENCLAGLNFVFTGVLETLGRDEGKQLVEQHGGKVQAAPSSKTSYVVLGDDAGPKKLDVIKKHNLKTLNQEGLFQLIRELPANGGNSEAAKAAQKKKELEETKAREMAKSIGIDRSLNPSKDSRDSDPNQSLLWTDKYAPQSLKEICGNKTVIGRLQDWLTNWDASLKSGFKKGGPDGSGLYRAVMITGPPGIGKTTSAHLVAKLAGYDILETNASDTRSKKVIARTFAGVLNNTSMLGYFGTKTHAAEASKKKIVLILDEVDGMSAGDLGGVGQMAKLCQETHIPMILICNDYSLPKMRPFDRVAFTLPFRRPDAAAIRSRILSIAYREGLKIPAQVIDQLVQSTHADIRQIINLLSSFRLRSNEMTYEDGKVQAKAWEKNIVLKPFDIAGQLLSGQMFVANNKYSLNDKLDLYFNDHDFTPLMIQENYLRMNPQLARTAGPGRDRTAKVIDLIDRAASSISDGDLCDRMIHGSQQQWSLMPLHGILSSVRPSAYICGSGTGERFQFTSWLGQFSKQNKLSRFLQEIQSHVRLRISGDRHEVRLQYLSQFYDHLLSPILNQGQAGIAETIEFMDSYYLTKEDFDAILEISVGPGNGEDVWKKVATATKTAFTRKYNAMSHPIPFIKSTTVQDPKKIKKEVPDLEEAMDDVLGDDAEGGIDDEDEEGANGKNNDEDDLSKDKYIKKPTAKKAGAKKSAATKGKKKK
ncbi:replication factor RFC1 C terminal domain-containing protein [Lipomyces japonicus]|uniref:replication factor RFC1 C terminal domain-containing protein n=1 Tax=Lipomyces japonicus TaxID=56871 RepID=UPI0034D00015